MIGNLVMVGYTGGPQTFTGPILAADGSASAPGISFASDTDSGFLRPSSDTIDLALGGTALYRFYSGGLAFASGQSIVWASGALGTGADLFLTRDAGGTLAQRNGTNAQTFRLYNTFTDSSNYERLEFKWNSNVAIIGTSKAGTGAARELDLQIGSTVVWYWPATGHLLAGADNTYDIGASGANRPRNLYLGGTASIPALSMNAGRAQLAKGAAVASANNLSLGTDGNVFHITGTTQINLLDVTNWQAGSVVYLIFDASVTVKHNTATSGVNKSILLAGAVDLSATANDTLTLVYDGTSWFELARTVI